MANPNSISAPNRVAAILEQCWHRVPGGTAISAVRSMQAVAATTVWSVVGVAARHRNPPAVPIPAEVPVTHMPLRRRALYDAWHYLRWPLLQRYTGRVDVVHGTGGVVPAPGNAALVMTIHDLAFLYRPEHFTRRGVRFMQRALDLTRRLADLVIVPSEATLAECVDAGFEHHRLRVIPWGCRPAAVTDAARHRVRQRYSLPAEFLLWAGTAEPRKNLVGLLQAYRQAKSPWPLILVGPAGWGDDAMPELTGGVRHIGEVPSHDLEVLYDLAGVFVYPSLAEGFGLPVLEAMAHATPVITARGTATEEVAGPGGLLINPTDSDSLAAAICELTSDVDRRAQLGMAAATRAAGFTWERTAALISAVYDEARS